MTYPPLQIKMQKNHVLVQWWQGFSARRDWDQTGYQQTPLKSSVSVCEHCGLPAPPCLTIGLCKTKLLPLSIKKQSSWLLLTAAQSLMVKSTRKLLTQILNEFSHFPSTVVRDAPRFLLECLPTYASGWNNATTNHGPSFLCSTQLQLQRRRFQPTILQSLDT